MTSTRRVLALALIVALTTGVAAQGAPANVKWIRQFGTPVSDVVQGVAATGKAIYVAGYTYGDLAGHDNQGSTDGFVRRYSPSGGVVWTRHLGTTATDIIEGIAADASGIYVVGTSSVQLPGGEVPPGNGDPYLRKYSHSGSHLWTRQFGTTTLDSGYNVAVDGSGVYVVGETIGEFPGQTNAGGVDAFVSKFTHSGSHRWTRQIGTAGTETGRGVAVSRLGVFVAGTTAGAFPDQPNPGFADAFVGRFSLSGVPDWRRQFGSDGIESAVEVAATASGIFAAGQTNGILPGQMTPGGEDLFVRRFTGTGGTSWTRQFGTSENEAPAGVAATPWGVFVGGSTYGSFPGYTRGAGDSSEDGFVRKFSPSGRNAWTRQLGSGDESTDTAYATGASSLGSMVGIITSGGFAGYDPQGSEDVVIARIAAYRPDALISGRAGGGYIGNDRYNTTASRQVASASIPRGSATTFYVRVQNDGDATDAVAVDGCGSSSGFDVRYFSKASGGKDVTRAVRRGTFTFKSIAPMRHATLRMVIRIAGSVSVRSSKDCKVVLTSKGAPARKDAVKARVTATS